MIIIIIIIIIITSKLRCNIVCKSNRANTQNV